MTSLFPLIFLICSISTAKEVLLQWRPIEGATTYRLQVSSEPAFNSPVIDKVTEGVSLKNEIPAGIYFLRVATVGESGKSGKWGKPFKLVVTADVAPEKAEEEEIVLDKKHKATLSAQWKKEGTSKNVRVIVERDGEPVLTREIRGEQFDYEPKEPGNYTFKVSTELAGKFGKPQVVKTFNVQETQNLSSISSEDHHLEKSWFVGLGPVLSFNGLQVNGTKYGISLGLVKPLSEHWNSRFLYTGAFNTGAQGSTPISALAGGTDYFFSDRLSSHSFFLALDAGYGGSNRYTDAGAILGFGDGFEFFRSEKRAFEVALRSRFLLGSNVTWQEIEFGILW